MKILKALYAAELLLAVGAGASRAGPDGRTHLKGSQSRLPKHNLRRQLKVDPCSPNPCSSCLPGTCTAGNGNNFVCDCSATTPPASTTSTSTTSTSTSTTSTPAAATTTPAVVTATTSTATTCGPGSPWCFCDSSTNVDVTIIGAGATALGAARFIERYNEMNTQEISYRILEADGAPGVAPGLGRAIATYFIHGAEGNPIYELKWLQEQVRGEPVLSEATVKWSDVKQFTCTGEYDVSMSCEEPKRSTVNKARNEFIEVEECVRDDLKIGLMLDEALDQCYADVRDLGSVVSDYWLTDGDKSRTWFTFDYDYAEDPRSTADFSIDPAYTCTGQDKDVYVQSGVKTIIEREIEYYGIDQFGCAGAKVTDVSFLGSGGADCEVGAGGEEYCVKIETETGGPFHTKQVILTPSVGVLSRSAANGGIDIEGFNTGSPSKYDKMMEIFFTPDTSVTKRVDSDPYNPLYYVIAFQFSSTKAAMWNDDYALINVDFKDTANPDDSPRGKCRWWEVWNNKWGDWHHPDNNMIACVLTTEDIEALEERVGGPGYSIPPPPTSTSDLNTEITNLFRNSLGIAYNIWDDADPNCERVINFDPNSAPASDLSDHECLYRVFPNKENELWYGSWEGVTNSTAYEGQDYQDFIAPIDNPYVVSPGVVPGTIHMAGAATCYNYWGFIQGSYYSGIGAANATLVNLDAQGTFPDNEKLDTNWCASPPPFSIGSPRRVCNDW